MPLVNANHQAVVKTLSHIFILLTLLSASSIKGYAQSKQEEETKEIKLEVTEIQSNYLIFKTFQLQGEQRVDLSDVIVAQEIIGKSYPLNAVYGSAQDFKEILLRKGLAELRSPEAASPAYRNAQQEAINNRRGIWEDRFASEDIRTGLGWLITGIGKIILTGGVLALIIALLKRYWFRRPVRLLIFGEVSAGKTAIYERLLDPKVDRAKLEALIPSQSVTTGTKKIGITRGEYVIYPSYEDIPGSFLGKVWDAILKFRFVPPSVLKALIFVRFVAPRVWLYVVAPTPDKETTVDKINVDHEYISVQLGIIKSLIMGGLDARKTTKPKAVLLFMNKFDLFSAEAPSDSLAKQAKQEFSAIFSKHKQVINTVSERHKDIHYYAIVGSAFESWGVEEIFDRIGHALHGS